MRTLYNSEELSSILMYHEVNNLYRTSLSRPVPYDGFDWAGLHSLINFEFDWAGVHSLINFDVPDDDAHVGDNGYILELYIHYSTSLHETHKDLPLCPEHIEPPLSKF